MPPVYRDRSTGLVIFGVAQIILGLMAGMMVPFVALSVFMSRLAPGGRVMHLRQMVMAASIYAFIAAAMLALGIGSIQKKRWARALTLVSSWYWLITGLLITVLLTATLPVAMRTVLQRQQSAGGAQAPELSTGIMAVILTVIILFCAFFLIAVPVAFVVFYGRQDVKLTCHDRDPVERWTDRTPLPVLAASVVLAVGAMYFFVLSFTTPMFPFFGHYLTGPAGSAGMIALAVLDAYLALALFRLRSAGWWLAVITMALRLVSLSLTYARADLMRAYSKMGWSDSQLQVMNASPVFRSHVILWWSLISMFVYFGYLLWLKRYFVTPAATLGSESLSLQAD
jgi:hypothetical protein